MTLKNDTKLERNLTCALQNDRRCLANFHQSTRKSKKWDYDEIILSKEENLSA